MSNWFLMNDDADFDYYTFLVTRLLVIATILTI